MPGKGGIRSRLHAERCGSDLSRSWAPLHVALFTGLERSLKAGGAKALNFEIAANRFSGCGAAAAEGVAKSRDLSIAWLGEAVWQIQNIGRTILHFEAAGRGDWRCATCAYPVPRLPPLERSGGDLDEFRPRGRLAAALRLEGGRRGPFRRRPGFRSRASRAWSLGPRDSTGACDARWEGARVRTVWPAAFSGYFY